MTLPSLAGVILLTTAAVAAEQPAPTVELLVLEGQTLPGSDGLAIASLGMPVGDGIPGWAFTGVLEDGDGFVWRDGSLVWRNSDAERPRPVGAAPFMGVGNDGAFVFRTVVADEEALWSHNGLLIRSGEQAPGFDPGVWLDFHRRAMMTSDGTAFWVSGFVDGTGAGGAGRVLYASPDATPENIQVVLRSDDLVEGIPIARPSGLTVEFRVSNDMAHLIHNVILDTGSNLDDEALYLDGTIAVREGDEAGPGIQWDRFLRVSVNSEGDYMFSGIALFESITNDSNRFRAVLAYNGEIQLSEGETLSGVRLQPPASILGLDIDDNNRAVHLWSTDGLGPEYLFFACDAASLQGSLLILEAPMSFTITLPGRLDVKARLFRFSDIGHGPVLLLGAEDTQLRVGVELMLDGFGDDRLFDAILSVDLPACPLTDPNRVSSLDRSTSARGPDTGSLHRDRAIRSIHP